MAKFFLLPIVTVAGDLDLSSVLSSLIPPLLENKGQALSKAAGSGAGNNAMMPDLIASCTFVLVNASNPFETKCGCDIVAFAVKSLVASKGSELMARIPGVDDANNLGITEVAEKVCRSVSDDKAEGDAWAKMKSGLGTFAEKTVRPLLFKVGKEVGISRIGLKEEDASDATNQIVDLLYNDTTNVQKLRALLQILHNMKDAVPDVDPDLKKQVDEEVLKLRSSLEHKLEFDCDTMAGIRAIFVQAVAKQVGNNAPKLSDFQPFGEDNSVMDTLGDGVQSMLILKLLTTFASHLVTKECAPKNAGEEAAPAKNAGEEAAPAIEEKAKKAEEPKKAEEAKKKDEEAKKAEAAGVEHHNLRA